MTFMHPELLLILIIWWPLCFWLTRLQANRSHWSNVIEPALLKILGQTGSNSKQRSTLMLTLLGSLIIIAISGPALKQGEIETANQGNLYVVLDNSLSMAAADLSPDRLSRAKWMVEDWAKSGLFNRTSISVYAASAHLLTPLTQDIETLKTQLNPLTPYLMPKQGSEPELAFEILTRQIAQQGDQATHILWLTDEIKNSQIAALKAAIPDAASKTLVAVGTNQPTPIPLENQQGYFTYNNEMVMVSTDDRAIAQTADELGFRTLPLGAAPDTNLLNQLSRQKQTINRNQDIGYWLLIPIAMLFLWQYRNSTALQLGLVLMLSITAAPKQATAASLFKNANQQAYQALLAGDSETALSLAKDPAIVAQALYDRGNYQQAAELFSGLDSAEAQFNAGNAFAQAQQFDQAIHAYEQALSYGSHAAAKDNKQKIEDFLNSQQQSSNQDQASENSGEQQEQQGEQQQNQSAEQSDQQQQNESDQQSDQNQPTEAQESENESQQQAQAQQNKAEESETDEQTAQQVQADAQQTQNDQDVEAILNKMAPESDSLLRYKFRYQYQKDPNETQANPW